MKNIMKVKKSLNRGTLFLLVALTFGICFVNYNLSTLLFIKHQFKKLGDLGPNRVDPVIKMPEGRKWVGGPNRKFHVVVTASDTPYSKWQCRIMYYWYRKVKDLPGSDMGGFTRVLHSGQPDNLMEEIPSFVVDPLPHGLDLGYVVLNRPWAFVQWLEKATIEEEYVLMGEPDHLFVKPLPNLASKSYPVAYPFFYIKPDQNEKIIRKFYPKGSISNVDPIGNSPAIITKSLLKEIAPTWLNVSLKIKYDSEADQTFGWVQEILHGTCIWGRTYIIHYTYGCDYTMKGELTYGKIGEWRFDKRSYLNGPPPKNLTLPPPAVPETVTSNWILFCHP
ncbi:Hydroxyproline O-arabinosyltransferase 3 [Bienertia sinuspersici]